MLTYSKKNKLNSPVRARNLRFESLETRELLSVSPGDYAVIRECYQTLDLPEAFGEVNIVEIDSSNFTGESLQKALAEASETPNDDLIVLKAEGENVFFDLGETTLKVDVDSETYGAVSLVSYGGTGVSSLISSSSDGAFNVVQGDFQLGGLVVLELGVDKVAPPTAGLQTDQVAFVCKASDSSNEDAAWSVDYETEGTERVFLTGLDETQALALATTSTDAWFVTNDYYDADKTSAADNDDHICWAAAAANILWYTGWGQITPFTDEQNLFESVFVNNFTNKTSSSYYASKWFITGEYPTDLDDTWSKPSSGGGYYQQALEAAGDSVSNYVSHSNFLTSPSKTSDLATKLQSGYGIGVSVEWFNKTTGASENSHSITIWGYSYNSSLKPGDRGYYTSLYFTDSDDYQKEERLIKNLSVSWHASCYIEGKYQGAYVMDGYSYGASGSNAVAAITGATFVAQRPSKYASYTGNKPNLYPSAVADGASVLLTTSSSAKTNSDTFLANSPIYTNFAFTSTKAVSKTVKCQLWLDGTLFKTFTYKSLKAGQSYGPGSTNISLGKFDVGTHTLRLVIDSDSAVDEYNENDNYFQRTFYVLESDSIFVTTAKDVVNANDGVTSLREAISLAGTTGYGSTICFDSSLKGQTIKLTASLSYLYVQRAITIDASTIWDAETDSPGITINAQGKTCAFCLSGGTSAKAVKLVGLKITNGAGLVPTNDKNSYGGAIYAINYVDLVDCVFDSNKAWVGGAIYSYQGSLSIQNCTFNKNTVSTSTSEGGLGGAIYLYEGSLNVDGGYFTENTSVSAGAIFSYNCDATISGASFVKNVASQYAGAAYFSQGTINVSDSFFSGNSAGSFAGALEFSEVTGYVYQSVFRDSTSGAYGGAAYVYSGSVSFVNSEFRNNTAATYGGGVFLHGQNQHYFSNCALVDNHATSGVGEALFEQYYTGTVETILATMRNCTVAGESNNAIYIDGAQCGLKMYNSIVVGSSTDIYASSESSTMEAYNVLSTYTSWSKSGKTFAYDSSKSLFADANAGDYSLAFQSQALDVGVNKYAVDSKGVALENDILGGSRVICTNVDLGAYERELESTPETPTNLTLGTYNASKKTIPITWSDNSNLEYYYVVETSADGKIWTKVKTAAADTTSWTLSKIGTGASCFVRVSATNRAGASQYAYASRYIPNKPTAPGDVHLLTSVGEENTTYTVLWNDQSNNESYFAIQVSTDGKTWTDCAKTNANVESFESTATLKYVRVAAGNSSGLSAYTKGSSIQTTSTLEADAGSELCLKLNDVDSQTTITWDFGDGVNLELKNGTTVEVAKSGLTPGVSLVSAQYVDASGATQKSTVEIQIAEASPSLAVETLPSVNSNVALFRVNASFAGRVVDRNWRVDWGDGTQTTYNSTHDFLVSRYYKSTKKATNYDVTITLLDASGADVETFSLGRFTSPVQASAALEVLETTENESIFEQAFENADELEESEAAVDAIVYGPQYFSDVFADSADDNLLSKSRVKKGFTF